MNSEAIGNVPIILEIGLQNFVPVVELHLIAALLKVGDLPRKQISEGIARGNRGSVVEIQHTIDLHAAEFVLLRSNGIDAKLKVVTTYNLADVVAKGIGGIGVIDSFRPYTVGILIETAAVHGATAEIYSWHFATKTIAVETAYG